MTIKYACVNVNVNMCFFLNQMYFVDETSGPEECFIALSQLRGLNVSWNFVLDVSSKIPKEKWKYTQMRQLWTCSKIIELLNYC